VLHRATLRDVAERAGVGIATASRALNGGSISEALRDRVRAAAEDLGYQPHRLAMGLRTGATKTVGFVVSDVANPVLGRTAQGAVSYLDAAGYTMMLAVSDGYVERERSLIRMMHERRADGLILSCSDETDPRLAAVVSQLDIPVVLLDRELPVSRVHRLLVNHRQGLIQAVEYLFKLGHRRVGYVGGPSVVRPSRERYEAFETAARAHGIWDERLVALGPLTAEAGREATISLMTAPPAPTALIVADNRRAIGALRAIHDLGLDLPRDLSLVALSGDVDALALHNPPITIVDRPLEEMGMEAAKLLLASLAPIDAIDRPVTRTFDGRLLIRGSTAPPPSHPD
jgi:LacI family transcriptional regulator